MSAPILDLPAFADEVQDALEVAGHEHWTVSGDGFAILEHESDSDHVLVMDKRTGLLRVGDWSTMNRQRLAGVEADLLAAGYGVDWFERHGETVGLLVRPRQVTP
ncbi:hypothetical protein [Acrocarpospora catenulata]|uniref:hypothetical protein n=1 Tax=Acrocarpospora catenulata TaxID=2836182 RepID=UPI001BD99CB3|nr:hypothetical protein [Acrocarpospora catenulata]